MRKKGERIIGSRGRDPGSSPPYFKLHPQIGPLQVATFRTPTPQTESMFMASFHAALDEYRRLCTSNSQGA
jgi:hypothetical protein